jgi:hypothetical protein
MQWLRQLDKMAQIGDGIVIQPDVMTQAIKTLRDDWNFQNKKWTSPFCTTFVDAVELTSAQIMAGTLATESKGWSTSL